MTRLRADYVFGKTDAVLLVGGTSLSSPGLARLPAVASPDVAAVTLHDPATGTHEVVHVTDHTASATTATIVRAQEGTTAVEWPSGAEWVHAPTAADFAALIPAPASPAAGDLLRFDGTGWVQTATGFFEGTGSPEGVVTAPPGSRFINTEDGGYNGARQWVKATGTGATGWVVTDGDTGNINIDADIDTRTDGIVHIARLQRIGGRVDLYLDLTSPTDTTQPWIPYTLPVGFRPDYDRYGAMSDYAGNMSGAQIVKGNGSVNLYQLTANTRDRFVASWPTTNTWPIVL